VKVKLWNFAWKSLRHISHWSVLLPVNKVKTRAKDVLPNINRTHTRCTLPSHPGKNGMVPSAADWLYFQPARYSAFSVGKKFVPGDLDLWPLTLTFKLLRARDQTSLPCEFGANQFTGSRDISYTKKQTKPNKKATNSAKNRTLRIPLPAVLKCNKYELLM